MVKVKLTKYANSKRRPENDERFIGRNSVVVLLTLEAILRVILQTLNF